MKKILLFISILTCFFITNVKATSLTKEETNYYFTRYFSDSRYSEKLNIYRIDGDVVYCVEPGVSPGDEDYYPTTMIYLNVPDNIKQNITYYGLFGYDYPGHQNIKYYAAAQSLMWEDILGLVSPTTISTEPFNQGTQIDITNERNEILNLISNYKKLPSFVNATYTYLAGEENRINDNNKVLSYYTFDDSVSVEGNTVKFKFDDVSRHTINFRNKKYYKDDYTLYYSKNHQDMFKAGNIETVKKSFYINTVLYDVTVEKYDELNNPLKGAVFDFYDEDNNLIGSAESNENGKANPGNIFKYGNYYIKERIAPFGYVSEKEKYNFSINKNNINYKIKVINKELINNYTFIKYIRNKDNKKEIEKGAKFNLLDETGDVIGEYISDDDGMFKMSLKVGKYTLVQTYGKEGYRYIDDYIITVDNKNDDETIELYDDEIIKEEKKEDKIIKTVDDEVDIIEDIEVEDDDDVLVLEDVPYTYKSGMSISGLLSMLLGFSFFIMEEKYEK